MAARTTSARRLRWLVLLGLAGAGVWVLRSRRAGRTGLLEQWPARPSAPSSPARVPTAAPAPATAPAPAEQTHGPGAEALTPPLGIAVASAPVDPTPDEPDAVDPVPAPTTGANPLFKPPGSNGTDRSAEPPAEPPTEPPTMPRATRPSPRPRPRPAATAQLVVGSGAAAALPDGSSPGPEYTIKGNAGSMLFHRPDSPYYSRTKAEVWFRTATDARAAGFTEFSRNRTKDRLPGS